MANSGVLPTRQLTSSMSLIMITSWHQTFGIRGGFVMRYSIGMGILILCLLLWSGVSSPERPIPDTIWATWVPREMTTDKANIPELLVYIQSVLRTKHDPSIKVYVDLDVISSARFSKRHNATSDCQQNTNAPSLAGLDTPPLLDLRSALNLYCDVLGANWRQEGKVLFLTKGKREAKEGTAR